MIWIDGQRFEGDWKKDMMLKGRCRYPCGGEYYGEWKQNKKDGYGYHKDKNGVIVWTT
jgi:hypothetical protein